MLDRAGNSYVTGRFSMQATFGKGEAQETSLKRPPHTIANPVFVAKYDQRGRLVWATQGTGTGGFMEVSGLAVDETAHVYFTGSFDRTATFGVGEAHETTLSGAPHHLPSMFLAKYTPDGQLRWAIQTTNTEGRIVSTGVGVDAAGNSYVSGELSKTTTFGAGEPHATTLHDAGGYVVATNFSDH